MVVPQKYLWMAVRGRGPALPSVTSPVGRPDWRVQPGWWEMGWWLMGPKFAVRDDSVNRHASNLDTSVSALNAQAAAFTRAIEPLEGQWQGTAFGSWSELTSAWSDAMRDLNSALTSIRGRVGDAGHLYDQYEAQQTQVLQKANGSADWDATRFRA